LRDQYNALVEIDPTLGTAFPVGVENHPTTIRTKHTSPILSLKKAYSDSKVEAFLDTCGTHLLYCIEPKLDGLTVVLRYRDGVLTQALTRGDGHNGSDITAAILASGAVPTTLSISPARFDVRGEAILPLPAFKALNLRRIEEEKPLLKSPRNTAAGTLRLSDEDEIARRGLQIQLFELLATDSPPATHTQALALMRSAGLPVIESHTLTADHVIEEIQQMNNTYANRPYTTDGIVIKMDDRSIFEQLGATAHHPRGALARKYKELPVETQLQRVEWTRGKTGRLTPVGHFTPIDIQGATLQKATLHNRTYLQAMDLKLGDWIQVIRAGGSVPEIIGRCPNRRTGDERPIADPPE
ncbi:MAG: hypothetical protein KAG97_08745, partial [Victivallales bacterium]|nr:hypothetical protein [Victivallales bacterium]